MPAFSLHVSFRFSLEESVSASRTCPRFRLHTCPSATEFTNRRTSSISFRSRSQILYKPKLCLSRVPLYAFLINSARRDDLKYARNLLRSICRRIQHSTAAKFIFPASLLTRSSVSVYVCIHLRTCGLYEGWMFGRTGDRLLFDSANSDLERVGGSRSGVISDKRTGGGIYLSSCGDRLSRSLSDQWRVVR
ncbi:hypothetical protein BDV98DRAFT_385684 [Pterulicium gracile]|uniref:Uncharacterized protein n=1 Tax=Pterulicium gracile TaxID=1884261 RepID=A0A5C3QNF9_9AGAR|nr:hypothetical protein BDV98DRAFT_385684 [Pterula gracilis]